MTSSPAGAVEVPTDVGALWLPADCRVVTPALQQTGTWEPDQGTALARALKPGMTVLDVGAHAGYFAVLAARLVGPGGRVVAIEPSPDNFRLLDANVARLGLENVEAVNAAAWSESGEVELARCETNSGDHRVGLGGRETLRVRAVAIDDLLGPDATVDFVVLDTQGSELAVVAGMRRCIARSHPRMHVEFWPAGIRELGGDPYEVLAAYADLGYRVRVLEGGDDPFRAAEAAPGGFVTLVLTRTLSVCIPTHHGRRAELEQAIESAAGAPVFVSDNASADGTAELSVALGVTYHRSEIDIGAARNILRAVELADTDYVWLLGSDDRLEPGAIDRMLDLLDEHPGACGVTVDKRKFDATMTHELPDDPPELRPPDAAELHVYSDADTALVECGLAHGLISAQVVNRRQWLDAVARARPLERTTFAPHLFVITQMLRANPRWLWCPERLVRQRCDPAVPGSYGYAAYALLAAVLAEVEQFWADALGRGSSAYRSLLDRWVRAVLPPRAIVAHKRQPGHRLRDDARMLAGFGRHAWRSPYFRRRSLPALLAPHFVAERVFRAWRRLQLADADSG